MNLKIKPFLITFYFFLCFLLDFSLIAQQNEISIEEKIKILEEEIEELKEKKATKQYKSFQGLGPAASGVYYLEDGFSWGGYGEIKFKNYLSKYKVDNADVHRFILYAGYKFNDWIVLNSEIEYEHSGIEKKKITFCSDIKSGQCVQKTETIQQGEVYLEFSYIDFLFTDYFQLSAGLILLPIGITNYYHEPTTFFTVERPYTETMIIPSTWRDIGIMAHGKFLKDFVLYRIGIVNGMEGSSFSESDWIRGGRQKGSKVNSQDLGYFASLEFFPLEGFTIGTSYYLGGSGQKEIPKVDLFSRLDFNVLIPGSDDLTKNLRNHIQKEYDNSRLINPKVQIAEGHIKYESNGIYLQGLLARGWIKEEEVRALNAKTSKNIGSTVEGGYINIGYDLASLFGLKDKKIIIYYQNEYINTQKKTLKNNGQLYIEKEIANQMNTIFGSNLFQTNFSKHGFINSINSTEVKTILEQYDIRGVANPINDRRIHTFGLAFYPHPNVAIKLDYEDWNSKSNYYQDSDFYNQSNNNIDVVNLAITFIF